MIRNSWEGSINDQSTANRKKKWWHQFTDNPGLTIGLVALVIARSVDQSLFYRLNFSYGYFVWYFSSVILTIGYLVICWPIVFYKMLFTTDITEEMLKFPKWKFAIMGLFDALYNIFSTFPVQHLGGDLSNVLSQSVLPINMILAAVFLKTVFKKNHYLGAFLVIYGIAIKLSDNTGWSGSFPWILMMIVAQIPAGASNVYKQLGMQSANLDEWYANAWIGFFQLIIGVITFWTMFISAFMAPSPAINSLSSFSEYFKNANKCFFGEHIEVSRLSYDQCTNGGILEGDYNNGTCYINCSKADMAPCYTFAIYIIFNIAYNYLMLYTFRIGSSVLSVVVSAARLPIVDGLNSWGFIAGPAKEKYGKYDTFSLIILIIAFIVYYAEPETTNLQQEEEEEDTSERLL